MVVGPLEVLEKFRVGGVGWGGVGGVGWGGWGGWGGLFNYSVTPVQSWTVDSRLLTFDSGLWSWTGLRLDFRLTISKVRVNFLYLIHQNDIIKYLEKYV